VFTSRYGSFVPVDPRRQYTRFSLATIEPRKSPIRPVVNGKTPGLQTFFRGCLWIIWLIFPGGISSPMVGSRIQIGLKPLRSKQKIRPFCGKRQDARKGRSTFHRFLINQFNMDTSRVCILGTNEHKQLTRFVSLSIRSIIIRVVGVHSNPRMYEVLGAEGNRDRRSDEPSERNILTRFRSTATCRAVTKSPV